MNIFLSILAALGGAVIFIGAVWALVRGLIRQSDAVKDNTEATRKQTEAMIELTEKVERQNTRLSILEDWRKGAGH